MKIFLLIIILIVPMIPVFAQSEETPFLTVTTDDTHYDEGDIVVVSGKVKTIIVDTPILLQLWFEGKMIDIAQFFPAQDGSYSHTIIAEKPLWNKEGEYTARVSYGTGNISETTFTFTPKKEFVETKDSFEVNIPNGGTFDADYSILGAKVTNMILEPENFMLRILLDAPDEGTLSIKLPRDAIDAMKQNGDDEKFIVLIDDIQNPYSETETNSDYRLISIHFQEGDSEIAIIGTHAVPEFGTVVSMILLISITTSIIITKYRFSLKF